MRTESNSSRPYENGVPLGTRRTFKFAASTEQLVANNLRGKKFPLDQLLALVSAQGYSLTNKVLQTCNGWLMEAKRGDGSPAVVLVDPKTQTIVDADFR